MIFRILSNAYFSSWKLRIEREILVNQFISLVSTSGMCQSDPVSTWRTCVLRCPLSGTDVKPENSVPRPGKAEHFVLGKHEFWFPLWPSHGSHHPRSGWKIALAFSAVRNAGKSFLSGSRYRELSHRKTGKSFWLTEVRQRALSFQGFSR